MANVPDDSKEYFSQENLPEPTPPGINIVPTPTGSQVEDGSLRSSNYRTGSSGWSINSDGTAEFVGLEATNIITTQSFPVSATMGAGTPVGVDWEGKIAEAMRSFPDDATNQPTFGEIMGVYPLSQNNFVVLYEIEISSTWYFRAVIATVSSTTNDVSFGTYAGIASLVGDHPQTVDCCQVDTATFVTVYNEQVGSENVYATAFSVSGTTINVGTQKLLTTTDNLAESGCCKSDTNEFVWCGYRDTFGDWEIGYATVSGTTITTVSASGTSIANITDVASKDIKLAQVGTGKVAIIQCSNGYVAIGTTDGSMVTGTAVSLLGAGSRRTSSVVSPADDTFFAHMATNLGYFTVSGTVPSLQGSLVARTGSEGGMVLHNGVVYDLQTNPTDDQNAGLWSVTQAGASAVLTQLSSGKKVASVYFVASDGYKMFALCAADLSYWLSSMSYNFIGFLQDGATTTSGQNGRVVVRGIVDGLSGLVPGSYYLVSGGTLTRISPVETVNTLDDVVNVVKAISSTQILV